MDGDKTIVDFIPVSDGGDFKKIKDSGPIKINNIINTLLNHLDMEEGTVEEYPKLGCYQEFVKILFEEDSPYSRLDEIEQRLTNFFDNPVKVSQIADDKSSFVKISIEIEGIPGLLKVDIDNTNQYARIVNPRFIR